jgi:hypothetical protein
MEDNATLKPKTDWHEVFEPGDSIPQAEARNQDLGGRPIDLLVPATIGAGGELESPPFVIQYRSENAGRVKLWVAVPVDRTFHHH